MDTKPEINESEKKSGKPSESLLQETKNRIMGLNQDIAQANEVKQEALTQAKEAMKAGDLKQADVALNTADMADQAVTNMRLEQFDLQKQLDAAKEPATPPAVASDTQVESQPTIDQPPPGESAKLTKPKYIEALEGNRNQEDDLVETNYELHPPGEEGKLSRR